MKTNTISNTVSLDNVGKFVNKNVKQRKYRKIVILIVTILLMLLLLFFLGFFAFYLIRRKDQESEIVLDVRVNAFEVSPVDETQRKLGSSSYSYKEGDKNSMSQTNSVEYIFDDSDNHLKLDYNVYNKQTSNYNYELDFSNLELNNFDVIVYIYENDSTHTLTPDNNKVSYVSSQDLIISIVIKVIDLVNNATCKGNINFSISVA